MSNRSSRCATSRASSSSPAGPSRRGAAEAAPAVARDHRGRAREQVSELVRELALVSLVHVGDRGVPVLAERDGPRAPEADRVGAVEIDQLERVDDVPERLRDLAVVEQQEPVHEQLLRHLVARREQERRPDHAVEAKDVLAEHVPHGGPELRAQILARPRIGQGAQVVDERVDPDIDDVLRVPGHRNAPGLARAADADVLEALLDEAPRLVRPEARQHELRPLRVELEQPLLVGGEPEEPVALLDPLERRPVLRAVAVDRLGLGVEGLARRRSRAPSRCPRRCRRCRRSAGGIPGRIACAPHPWCE